MQEKWAGGQTKGNGNGVNKKERGVNTRMEGQRKNRKWGVPSMKWQRGQTARSSMHGNAGVGNGTETHKGTVFLSGVRWNLAGIRRVNIVWNISCFFFLLCPILPSGRVVAPVLALGERGCGPGGLTRKARGIEWTAIWKLVGIRPVMEDQYE